MLKKLRKWNWGIFWFILIICCIGALGNKSITHTYECFIITGIFGIPMGLLWAWLTKEE